MVLKKKLMLIWKARVLLVRSLGTTIWLRTSIYRTIWFLMKSRHWTKMRRKAWLWRTKTSSCKSWLWLSSFRCQCRTITIAFFIWILRSKVICLLDGTSSLKLLIKWMRTHWRFSKKNFKGFIWSRNCRIIRKGSLICFIFPACWLLLT